MFGFVAGVIVGGVIGTYAAQNYEVPNIKDIMGDFKGRMKKYEKPKRDLPSDDSGSS
ncbi:short transmembrane mitochondrial protein 1-like [Saccoglossus kowalevskii]